MFMKMSVEEYLEKSGCDIKNITMCDEEVVCVYLRSDYEGSSLGCKYVDGSYSVVGGGRGYMCDYRDMFCMVMSF